ncbi:MAG: type I restriction endonuclease subunit R [Prevotella sp.]|nr:type I restriction endonuclease subunit R [Prevotella sp.]
MTENKIVIENPKSTVVANYQAEERTEMQYQSEAALEKAFIQRLQGQAYEYLPLHTEQDLISNLRRQMERLNGITFTDAEWRRFYTTILANQNNGIIEKTRLIQEDNVQTFLFDNGEQRNIRIFDKRNVHNNSLQVINQYTPEGGTRDNRYDVTILVNGLPLVHVELKRRGVPIREAFNQIDRYQRESFWSGTGLFQYVQIFVISNGTETKYYSNTTRFAHVRQNGGHPRPGQGRHANNSFEFTSWWADGQNVPISDLMDFTNTFFAKHTLLNIIAKYCIFTSEQLLMVMRPYQICATEKIINRIIIAHNYHWEGSIKAGGYIWHTTGSGKTLTSFKTARLATQLDFIDKVVFVVDRKDLDYQTMKEYDRFEKGAANSNSSSNILRRQLSSSDPQKKLVITTIQKLASMLKNKAYEDEVRAITQKQMVFIFDECHRSQFGDMHTLITRKFKRYYIFGFTGTPIFPQNAGTGGNPKLKTTAQAFGDKLHSYTIVDAIRDRNVLPFRVEYISTMKEKKDIENEEVWSIDTDNAFKDPRRIKLVTEYIIHHFNQKTKRNDRSFAFNKLMNVREVATAKRQGKVEELKRLVRMTGFNSILAVASIEYAKLYYNEFKRQHSGLKVATIFSYGVNDEDDGTGMEDENNEDTNGMLPVDRDFLEKAIKDYNAMFGTNYDTSADKFQNYYKDVSLRMKNREIDLLIVVNMFLTGFDATTLNTLWVDKNLRMHGLLQAYSRTNRILNAIKTFGNVVCFRNLEKATNDAIALFGNKDACGLVLMRTYEEYYRGYEDDKGHHVRGYEELVELLRRFRPGEVIVGEEDKKAFVQIFGALLRVLNILQAFDQFAGHELISERDMQDYLGMYNEIYQAVKSGGHDKEKIKDDLVFEMELVKQVEINIDYILALVRKYRGQNGKDRELTLRDIDRAIRSSPQMRDKKALIDAFVRSVTPGSDVDDDWNTFVRQKMQEEINDIISTEHLKDAPARKFIRDSFDNGYVQTEGTGIADIMPPLNPFKQHAGRAEKKAVILDKIKALFNRFYGLIGPAPSYEADKAVKRYTLPEEDGELLMAAEPGPAGA